VSLLALFDVDGTLFLTHDALASEALKDTVLTEFGVSLPGDAVDRVDHQGQTMLRIARLVLRNAGLPDAKIDERLQHWCAHFADRYVELLADADSSGWKVAPGAAAALDRLQADGIRLALLTGNPEPMARARMERLGLARYFGRNEGAFGCDRETRPELTELARERAGNWPVARTVAIGDTARDARSARESGIRSIVVRFGRTEEAFADADAICDDLDAAATQVLAWSG
jgi:phosphoglycolate phosphatase